MRESENGPTDIEKIEPGSSKDADHHERIPKREPRINIQKKTQQQPAPSDRVEMPKSVPVVTL